MENEDMKVCPICKYNLPIDEAYNYSVTICDDCYLDKCFKDGEDNSQK